MRHARARAVREHIAGARAGRRLQQAGDALDVIEIYGDGLRAGPHAAC